LDEDVDIFNLYSEILVDEWKAQQISNSVRMLRLHHLVELDSRIQQVRKKRKIAEQMLCDIYTANAPKISGRVVYKFKPKAVHTNSSSSSTANKSHSNGSTENNGLSLAHDNESNSSNDNNSSHSSGNLMSLKHNGAVRNGDNCINFVGAVACFQVKFGCSLLSMKEGDVVECFRSVYNGSTDDECQKNTQSNWVVAVVVAVKKYGSIPRQAKICPLQQAADKSWSMNVRLTFWVAMEDSEIAPIGLHTSILRELSCADSENSKTISKIGEWKYDFFTKKIQRVDAQENLFCEFCTAVAADEIKSVQNKNAVVTTPIPATIPNIVKVEVSKDTETKLAESVEAPLSIVTNRPITIRLVRSNPSQKKTFFSKKTTETNASESKIESQNLQEEEGKLAGYGSLHALLLQHQKIPFSDDNSNTNEQIMDKTDQTKWNVDEFKVCESFMQKEMEEVESPLKANGNYIPTDHPFHGKNGELKMPLLSEMKTASSNLMGKEENGFSFPQTATGKQF